MTGLYGDAQFQSLKLQILHKGLYALRDSTEIVVIHLLVLSRIVPHQRTPRQQQIRACSIETFIYQKVFLFPSQVRGYFFDSRIKIMTNICCCYVDSMQSAQQRSLIVKRFTAITDKDCRNTKRIVYDKNGRGGIPC